MLTVLWQSIWNNRTGKREKHKSVLRQVYMAPFPAPGDPLMSFWWDWRGALCP